jgi:DnaJ-class molecular chaperone with C-terminal Zn finger domain
MATTEETWHGRKLQRSIDYWRRWGVRMVECTACSGSGAHDSRGGPACDACGGSGRRRDALNSVESAVRSVESDARRKRNLVEMRRARREGRIPVLEHGPPVIINGTSRKARQRLPKGDMQ